MPKDQLPKKFTYKVYALSQTDHKNDSLKFAFKKIGVNYQQTDTVTVNCLSQTYTAKGKLS